MSSLLTLQTGTAITSISLLSHTSNNSHWTFGFTAIPQSAVITVEVFCCDVKVRKFLFIQQFWNSFLCVIAKLSSFCPAFPPPKATKLTNKFNLRCQKKKHHVSIKIKAEKAHICWLLLNSRVKKPNYATMLKNGEEWGEFLNKTNKPKKKYDIWNKSQLQYVPRISCPVLEKSFN